MATSPATAAKPAPAPTVQPPTDPLTTYYRTVRQMNLQLARERYKQGFKVRTQEYIRGRGTLAVVDEEICMGCTHCFDNCAFESIGMVDRKFALPEYSYTSRKAPPPKPEPKTEEEAEEVAEEQPEEPSEDDEADEGDAA